jgi:hypothetical protein
MQRKATKVVPVSRVFSDGGKERSQGQSAHLADGTVADDDALDCLHYYDLDGWG